MSVVLKAEKREKLGSSEAGRIRRSGRIPAVIYSAKGNANLSVDAKEFGHEYFKGAGLTTVFELEISGKKTKVVAHKIELDPVSDLPIHVDFLNCDELKTLRAQPKIVFTNQEKSPGLKKGGFLHVVLRRVAVFCESQAGIPEKIEIDIGAMHVGHKIRSSKVTLPAGIKFVEKGDFLIASIIGRGKSEEETPAAGATADGAASAAGSAAPAAKSEGGDKKAPEKKADKK